MLLLINKTVPVPPSMNTAPKLITCSCLAVFLFIIAPARAHEQASDKSTVTPALVNQSTESLRPTPGNILTSNQIAALLTEWTDEKSKAQLRFSATFGARSISSEEKIKYAKSGKIPLVITCQLDEIKDVQGHKLAKRMGGTAHFYILDPDGKVVVNKSVPLDKMCPS